VSDIGASDGMSTFKVSLQQALMVDCLQRNFTPN